jgi:hypothetical protein
MTLKTAIISLNSINQLIFAMETRCGFFEVGTASLNIMKMRASHRSTFSISERFTFS